MQGYLLMRLFFKSYNNNVFTYQFSFFFFKLQSSCKYISVDFLELKIKKKNIEMELKIVRPQCYMKNSIK